MKIHPFKFLIFIFLFSFTLTSCNALQNLDGGDSCGDRDGDGLTDCEETLTYFTSPDLVDSDGDGFSDFDEVREFGFYPDHDPYTFNPAIADVPIVQTMMLTPPDIRMLFEDGTEQSVERSVSSSTSISTTQTNTTSLAVEVGAEVGASITGPEVTASLKVTAGREFSAEYSAEQTKENSEAVGNTATTTFTGGKLAVALEIENPSNIAYTMTNLVIGGVALFPGRNQSLRPVGNLGIATVDFSGFTIGPGSKAGPLVFETDMDVALTRELLSNSKGLAISVATSEIQDADGISYSLRETEIQAKTAMVFIDYANTNGRPVEKYNVATNTDPNGFKLTLQQILENALYIPVVNSEGVGLDDIRGVAGNGDNMLWIGIHQTLEAGFETVKVYDPREGYDFASIEIFPGDFIRFIFIDDGDGDGIGIRQEKIQGTDPTLADTDGDGMNDFEEIYNGWTDIFSGETVYSSPSKADSDGDGVPDATEKALFLNPNRADTDGDLISDFTEINDGDPATIAWEDNTSLRWIAISAGYFHSLAIKDNGDPATPGGTLWAWGSNDWGELGTGDTAKQHTPVQVGTQNDWIKIAGGRSFSLGIRQIGTSKTLWSWGLNNWNQLGQGATGFPNEAVCTINGGVTNSSCLLAPGQVGIDTDWLEIAAGGWHGLGLRDDTNPGNFLGSIWAWGANDRGQMGSGGSGGSFMDPAQVKIATDWADVAAGGQHSMGVNTNNEIYSWGANSKGQLAVGTTNMYTNPVLNGSGEFIVASHLNSGVYRLNNRSYMAGSNEFHQLGYVGDSTRFWRFQGFQLESIPYKGAMALTGNGTGAVIALSATTGQGKIYTWGMNLSGELGRGFSTGATAEEAAVGSSAEWINVSGGYNHFLALKSNGTIYSWGSNVYSQTGRGSITDVGAVLNEPGLVQ